MSKKELTMDQKIDIVIDVAVAVGGTYRERYSGQDMYGRTCYAIDCKDPKACIEEAAASGLRGAVTDRMGKDYIVYWPDITG